MNHSRNFAPAAFLALAAAAAAQPLTKQADCVNLDTPSMRVAGPLPQRFGKSNTFIGRYPNTHQRRISPQQSMDCSEVPAGFRAELWAHERLRSGNDSIRALQAFTFDERGRVWAVETFDYPNTITQPFAGNDRVVILEDTNGDKVMDNLKVFVSGLNIPQGIELTPEGVVVAMAPYVILFRDANGDDRADNAQGQILYTGFQKGDTHGSVTSLRYGIDNRLWATNGYNNSTVNGIPFGAGVLRMGRSGGAFEYVSRTDNNTAGMGISEDNEIFASTANNNHTTHSVMSGVNVRILTSSQTYYPVTRDICQGDWFDNFTAASDHEIYSARLFPQRYWNRAAFVSEGTGHLVNVDFLVRNNSTWSVQRDPALRNIFASRDAWVAPVQSKTGPDGALWILDWHNYLYLHNGESPEGAGRAWCGTSCTGAGISPLRTKVASRIVRVVPATGPVEPSLNLGSADFATLVGTFRHTNLFWRLWAQKLILRRATTAALRDQVKPLLVQLMESRQKDAVDNDPAVVHAVWTAEGLGLLAADAATFDPILRRLLLHPAAGVRMNVLKAMPATQASADAIKAQGRANDPDAHVRLQAMLALAPMPLAAGGAVPVYAAYRNLDTYSQQAFTRAGNRVSESASQPSIPPLDAVVPVAEAPKFRPALRFARQSDGSLRLLPADLPAGVLRVFDLRGQEAARVAYDGRSWSGALRLPGGTYAYRFSGRKGEAFSGSLRASTGL